MPPVSAENTDNFCSLALTATNGFGIIRICTRDPWTIGRTLSCCATWESGHRDEAKGLHWDWDLMGGSNKVLTQDFNFHVGFNYATIFWELVPAKFIRKYYCQRASAGSLPLSSSAVFMILPHV